MNVSTGVSSRFGFEVGGRSGMCGLIALLALVGCGSAEPESDFEGATASNASNVQKAAGSAEPSPSVTGGTAASSGATTGGALYAEQNAPATVASGVVLVPGLKIDVTLEKDGYVDLTTVGSVWWDSGRCTVKFVIDGQVSATDDAEVGCPATGNRCLGFQSYYPFTAIKRVKGLSAGVHRIEVQLGSEKQSECSLMTEPDSVPTRLLVTATNLPLPSSAGSAK